MSPSTSTQPKAAASPGALDTAIEVITQLQDSDTQTVTLKNMSATQSQAVSSLLNNALALTSHDSRKEGITTTNRKNHSSTDVPDVGKINVKYNPSTKKTTISLLAYRSTTAVTMHMRGFVTALSGIIKGAKKNQVTLEGNDNRYNAISLSAPPSFFDTALHIITAIAASHGAKGDDMVAHKDGLPDNSTANPPTLKLGKFPTILIRTEAFDRMIQAEGITEDQSLKR